MLALIISFKATLAPYLALPYAACEGLAIGGISAMLEKRYPGIAIQAVGTDLRRAGRDAACLHARLIRVTQRFRAIVVGATGAIALLYLVSMVLGLFHVACRFMNDSSAAEHRRCRW